MLTDTKHNKSIPSPFCNKGWLLLLTLKAIQFPNHQVKTDDDEKKNKLIRGIPKHYLEEISELKKRRIYRLSANDFFLDAVAEKLDRMKKKLT